MRSVVAVLLFVLALSVPATAAPPRDRIFVVGDGTKLHALEAGVGQAQTILLIPGWTMPAWIWEAQIAAFSRRYRVVALDPRGQGKSEAPPMGYDHIGRARDMADAIAALGTKPVAIVAWSLGVLDTLAYIRRHGDKSVAGLVLVDNSVGEDPPPLAPAPALPDAPPRAEQMRAFVSGMFRTKRDPAWLEQLTQDCLRTPETAAKALLAYPVPRTYWREAVYATDRPLLYAVRPRLVGQAENLKRNRPATETEIFQNAGHALFVDEPARFDALVESFLRRRVWPAGGRS